MQPACKSLSPNGEATTFAAAQNAYNEFDSQTAVPTTTQMRVLVLSAVSVVVCATILGVLQYRSLVQLEIRTRITFQDDLLRSAQAIAAAVEGEVRSIGAAALSSFQTEDSNRDVQDLAPRFQELLRQQPEIDEVFLFALDGPSGTSAVFSTRNGADRCT
jgi:hypothetical protein